MKKTKYIFLFFLFSITAFSQTYNYFEQGSYYQLLYDPYCVTWQIAGATGSQIKTLDSNLFISGAGPFYSNGGDPVSFIKSNPSGKLLWSLHASDPNISTNYYSSPYKRIIQLTSDSGYLSIINMQVSGSMYSYAPWIFKIDKNGNFEWAKRYNMDTTYKGPVYIPLADIIPNYSGGFMLVGQISLNGPLYPLNLLLLNCDKDGNILWSRIYDMQMNASRMNPSRIQKTSGSGYVIAGTIFNSSNVPALIKVDSIGNLIFYKYYPIGPCNAAPSLVVTSSGGLEYYFMSNTTSTTNTVSGYSPYLLCTNDTGAIKWLHIYGSYDNSQANDLIPMADGGYLIGGARSYQSQLLLLKTDKAGNLQWAKGKGNGTTGENYTVRSLVNFYGDITMTGDFTPGLCYGHYTWSHLSPQGNGLCGSVNISYNDTIINNIATVQPPLPALIPTPTLYILPFPSPLQFYKGVPDTVICTTSINGVNESANVNERLIISPSPSSGNFQIQLVTGNWQAASIEIYNVMGEKIYKSTINSQQTTIDLSNQPNGIYFLTIKNNEGTANKKIIINH